MKTMYGSWVPSMSSGFHWRLASQSLAQYNSTAAFPSLGILTHPLVPTHTDRQWKYREGRLGGEKGKQLHQNSEIWHLISTTALYLLQQGLYRSWKTWKVMKCKNYIFQAWIVMKFNCWSWKVMENESYVW